MKTIKMKHLVLSLAAALLPFSVAAQSTIKYEYDYIGNVTGITNGNAVKTTQSYDALNRMTSQTDAKNGVTKFEYDGQDRLIKVTDARNLSTVYTIDGLGNQTQLISPDTGTSNFTYDDAGNLLSKTDAKQQTTKFAYDALSRLTQITWHDGSTTQYSYDQGQYGKGRLTKITDAIGSISYDYDIRGRILSESRSDGSVSAITRYSYDALGRLSKLTYPNGREVLYTRDSLGRISQIDTKKDGTSLIVVSDIQYQPFGGVTRYKNSVGQESQRSYDQQGRLSSFTLNNQAQAISYDNANRITAINDANNSARKQSFGYDELDRLTSFQSPALTQSFSYDAVGNRNSKTSDSANTSYSYGNSSNRLTQITDSQSRSQSYDANGSLINNAQIQFNYDVRGRLQSASSGAITTQYRINALGQRVQKQSPANGSTPASVSRYHYDLDGKLISESSEQGSVDYLYLGDIPVAVVR